MLQQGEHRGIGTKIDFDFLPVEQVESGNPLGRIGSWSELGFDGVIGVRQDVGLDTWAACSLTLGCEFVVWLPVSCICEDSWMKPLVGGSG